MNCLTVWWKTDFSTFYLPMWEPLQRYNALSSEARKKFRRAAILLPLVAASLRLRGYKGTHQWLQNKLNRRPMAIYKRNIWLLD